MVLLLLTGTVHIYSVARRLMALGHSARVSTPPHTRGPHVLLEQQQRNNIQSPQFRKYFSETGNRHTHNTRQGNERTIS